MYLSHVSLTSLGLGCSCQWWGWYLSEIVKLDCSHKEGTGAWHPALCSTFFQAVMDVILGLVWYVVITDTSSRVINTED